MEENDAQGECKKGRKRREETVECCEEYYGRTRNPRRKDANECKDKEKVKENEDKGRGV